MKTQLKKSAVLKTIPSKISTYLHKIDADPQEDDSDFDNEDGWTVQQNQLLPTPSLICCSPLHTDCPER